MSARPSLRGLTAGAVRRPTSALRTARAQKLRVFVVVSDALPTRVRRPLFAVLGAAAGFALRRQGDHPLAAPLHVVATRATRGRGPATAEAERLAAGASSRTITRIARVALVGGDPRAADRILRMAPAAPTATAAATATATAVDLESAPDLASDALRGEIAYRLGHFSTAVALLGPVLERRPRDEWTRRIAERAAAELALLDPAWRADLGSAGRAARPIAAPTRGRILHLLTNSLPYRQAGYTVRAQSIGLAQRAVGLDPQMVTRAGFPLSDGVAGAPRRETVDGVTYHRIRPDLEPGLPVDRIATETARALVPLIDSLRPALLQPTTNYINAQVALDLGERFGVPVVYEVRGFLEESWLSKMGDAAEAGDRYVAARTVETACMRRAAAIVTLSETMREDILSRGGIDADRVTVVPNAVDLDRFTPGPRDPALARTLGIESDETVLGYISSFSAYEGIAYLIEATALLRDRGRRVRLLLVGDGDERADLEATASRVGLLPDGVVFTGRVPHDQIERYYRTIDVFVVPRTNDRVSQLVTPLKPYEAMAMEKALVVSAVGALLEIVREDVTGRSFTPEDAGSLADSIEPLIDDPASRARLGAAARAWVAENRTWAQNGHRYLELYRRLGVA